MIIKANTHLGFNCKYLEKTVNFYKDILGCKEKFTLCYGDLIPKDSKRLDTVSPKQLAEWEKRKDVTWLVYLEWLDGYFIELFNEYTVHVENKIDPKLNYGYTHFAFVVDDIEAYYDYLIEKGAEEYIDIKPQKAIDGNYIMWFHDPEGNRVEVQQYTEHSLQIGGRGWDEQ